MKIFILPSFSHCLKYIPLLLAVTTFVTLAEEETPCDSMIEKTMLDEEIDFGAEEALDRDSGPSAHNLDSVALYKRDAMQHKVYSREEEQEIFQKYEEAEDEETKEAIREEIIINNSRLVFSLAKRHTNQGLDLADLIQEGNLGLKHAIDKFDYRRNNKFSTYAVPWIRQKIKRAIADKGRTIRTPVHMFVSIGEMTNVEHYLFHKLKRKPTLEEVAMEMGVSVNKIEKIKKSKKQGTNLSLDTPIPTKDGEEVYLMDIIKDRKVSSPEDDLLKTDFSEEVKKLLSILTEKEQKVLIMRFGIGLDISYTLEEVGQRLGLTRERVRQIQEKSMDKIRRRFPEARELLRAIASQ